LIDLKMYLTIIAYLNEIRYSIKNWKLTELDVNMIFVVLINVEF